MKFISTAFGVVLFVLFFGFALKNTQEVAGAALCILALTPTLFRQRRESNKQKSTIQSLQTAAMQVNERPLPDSINTQ